MPAPILHHDFIYGDIKLFSGTASPDLAQEISTYLGEPLCGRDIVEFPNEKSLCSPAQQRARPGLLCDPIHNCPCPPQLDGTSDPHSNIKA